MGEPARAGTRDRIVTRAEQTPFRIAVCARVNPPRLSFSLYISLALSLFVVVVTSRSFLRSAVPSLTSAFVFLSLSLAIRDTRRGAHLRVSGLARSSSPRTLHFISRIKKTRRERPSPTQGPRVLEDTRASPDSHAPARGESDTRVAEGEIRHVSAHT